MVSRHEVRGNNGAVALEGRRVIVTKSSGSKSERIIPLSAVTGVTLRPPQFMSPGYIQILTAGSREVRDTNTLGKVFSDTLVSYGRSSEPDFIRLAEAILDAIQG